MQLCPPPPECGVAANLTAKRLIEDFNGLGVALTEGSHSSLHPSDKSAKRYTNALINETRGAFLDTPSCEDFTGVRGNL